MLPTGEAVCTIPNALVALCLNTFGLARVRDEHALHVLLPVFTTRKYMKALAGETPSILGSGLEELFRFVPVLREEGVEALVAVVRALCILGGGSLCLA